MIDAIALNTIHTATGRISRSRRVVPVSEREMEAPQCRISDFLQACCADASQPRDDYARLVAEGYLHLQLRGAAQRVPLRRIHFFERFNDMRKGQAIANDRASSFCLAG